MKPVGEQKKNVLLLHAAGVKLIQAGADGHAAMRGRLAAALDDVGDDEDGRLAGRGKFAQRGHTHGMTERLHRGVIEAVPVLRQALGVGDRHAGNKNVGVLVGKLGGHEALSVFKFQFHAARSLFHVFVDDLFQSRGFERDRLRELRQRHKAARDGVDRADRCRRSLFSGRRRRRRECRAPAPHAGSRESWRRRRRCSRGPAAFCPARSPRRARSRSKADGLPEVPSAIFSAPQS